MRNILKLSLAISMLPFLANYHTALAAEKVSLPAKNFFDHKNMKPKHVLSVKNTAASANQVLLRKINVTGNKAIDSTTLKDLFVEDLGKKTNAANVQKKVEDYYHKEGFLLPVVRATEADSVFNVYITEGKINDVELAVDPKDADIANNELLHQYISKILSLSPAKTEDVQRYLLLIGKIPGYSVESELVPATSAKNNAVANLVLSITKTKGTFNLNASNYGNKDLGRALFFGGAKFNNPLGHNESIVADVGTSNHPDSLKLATVGYLKRLNSYGTSASILGSWLIDNPYKHSSTTPGSAKNDRSTVIKGQISQYLLLTNHNSFRLDMGAEYHNLSNNIIGQKASEYHYNLGFIKAKIKHIDCLDAENWIMPSISSTLNAAKQTIYANGTYKFDKNFTVFNLAWQRNQPLFSSNLSLFSQVTGQYSNDSLPLEQQFLIGSSSAGRTYKSGLVNANKGYDLNFELRYTHQLSNNKAIEVLQPYTFVDVSHFSNTNAITNNQNTSSTFSKTTLSGAGAGVRFFFPYEISAEVEAGIPFTRTMQINTIEMKNKNKYSFMLNKTFSW